MIYLSVNHGELDNAHLWLDDMVEVEPRNPSPEDGQPGTYVPTPMDGALCGADVPEVHTLVAAKETWAGNLMDLLGSNGTCEECRTRCALYYDMADEVTLDATSKEVPVCPECESYLRTATLRRVYVDTVDGEESTIATRQHHCEECHHEWETDVVIG